MLCEYNESDTGIIRCFAPKYIPDLAFQEDKIHLNLAMAISVVVCLTKVFIACPQIT